jgi:hypothetical protein
MRGYQRGIWLPEMQAERTVTGGVEPEFRRRPRKAVVRPVASPFETAASRSPQGEGMGAGRSTPSTSLRTPAKQSISRREGGLLRRFAPRIDAVRCAPAFSRRAAPEVCPKICPSKTERAQGRPGARCTRGLMCKMHKANAHEHTGSAETLRPSPRNGFTAYSVLSSVTGFVATVAPWKR